MLKQRDNRQKYGFSLFIPAWLLLSGANPTQIANSKWIAKDIWSLNNQSECTLNTIYLYTEVCCGSWRTLEAIQKSTSFSTIFCICCHPRENRNPMLIHFVWFMLKKPHEISPRSLSLIRALILITVTGYFFPFFFKNFCAQSPCKNYGTCQSGFTKQRYRCLCPKGYIGHDCETGKSKK